MRRWINICVCLFSPLPLLASALFYIERGDTVYLSLEPTASPTTRMQSSATDTQPWYRTSNGHRVMIANGVLVELHSGSSPDAIFQENSIISWEKLMDNIYLLTLADSADQFGLSRDLLMNSAVKDAHPNFVRERRAR